MWRRNTLAQALPQELPGRRNATSQCSRKPQSGCTLCSHSAQARLPPGVQDQPTSVHAQEALCPGGFHQAVYPRSRSQERKSLVSKRLLHQPPFPELGALIPLGTLHSITSPHPDNARTP